MKISRLPDRLDRMPMLKILVFFAAGIALAGRYELPLWFLAGAFVVTGVLALSLRSSAATVAMILTAGFAAAQFRAPRATVPRGVHTVYEVTVEGFPADRGRYVVADASVAAWRDPADGRWHAYAGTLWIAERTLLERLPDRHAGLHRRAVERLSRLPMSAGAAAVVEAMAAGERRGVTPELRTAYSRSGLSHLLAVSGLHTGIVFALVNLALWWLPLFRRGHLLKNLLAAVAVWLFVAAAGFPPSAVRAAAMCTVLQAALASASEYVGLNALAAAGFGMLVWNPNWLGDISFQLSFVAVAAILAWGVPLCRRCRTRWKGVNVVVDAYLIGFVATAATAPLVSHTFGVVPLAGLVVNPLAIALAGVVVFGGALWMLAPVGFLAPAFGFVTGSAAEGISALARLTASLPGGAADYTLGGWPTAAVYAVFALATLAAWSGEPKKNVSLRT